MKLLRTVPMWPSSPVTRILISDRPGRIPVVPQTFEQHSVSKRIHALPEVPVAEGHELAVLGEALERRQLPFRRVVVVDVIEDPGLEDEEASVDPSFADLWSVLARELWLLDESNHLVFVHLDFAEARRWVDDRHRGEPTVRSVEREQLREIHVRDTVAVRQHERLVPEVRREPLDPCTGVGVEPRFDEVDLPRFRYAAGGSSDRYAAVVHVDGQVGIGVGVVVDDVTLDVFTLVPECDREMVETMPQVMAHDVPEHRPAADLDHGLWTDLRLFREACPEAASQDADPHSGHPRRLSSAS